MSKEKYVWEEETDNTLDSFAMFDEDVQLPPKQPSLKKDVKNPNRKKKFRKKILAILIVLLVVIFYFFIPYKKVDAVNINELNFISVDDVKNFSNIKAGKRYSRLDMYKNFKKLQKVNMTDVSTKYIRKEKSYNITIEEPKPLALVDNNTFYYYDGKQILSTDKVTYQAPLINGFPIDYVDKILQQLTKLDYNIIKEISLITPIKNKVSDELVLLEMKDGNYVEINISQINEKMKYYLQIQSVINTENGGLPGILHLDIGDYYEPFKK